MKKFAIYFFFIIFLFTPNLFSQGARTLAVVKLGQIRPLDTNLIQFDLTITRTDPQWEYWVNGTIQLGFDDPDFPNFVISPTNTFIEFFPDSSEITGIQKGLPGGQIPKDQYYLTHNVLDGRISITISGPEKYDNCQFFDLGVPKRLGTFFVKTTGSRIPLKFQFLKGSDSLHPYYYYQALAYKRTSDSISNSNFWYYLNDNVEMDNGYDSVHYEIDDKLPVMDEDSLQAIYRGDKQVELRWMTRSEPIHQGFILERLLKPYDESGDGLKYDTPVGSWDSGLLVDTTLRFNPRHMGGHNPYIYTYDRVPYREETYKYRLLYEDKDNNIIPLDTTEIDIPEVLIYADSARPNPFGVGTDRTTIYFRLEESAYVTMKVYDLEGRLVETILENVKLPRGEFNEYQFVARPFSQQGLYDIIIIAYPAVDMPIEIGKAVIKVQYVR